MVRVVQQLGISFLLVRFSTADRYFYLSYEHLKVFWDRMLSGGRKSITLEEFEEYGIEITPKYAPRVNYLKIVNDLYV